MLVTGRVLQMVFSNVLLSSFHKFSNVRFTFFFKGLRKENNHPSVCHVLLQSLLGSPTRQSTSGHLLTSSPYLTCCTLPIMGNLTLSGDRSIICAHYGLHTCKTFRRKRCCHRLPALTLGNWTWAILLHISYLHIFFFAFTYFFAYVLGQRG